MNTTKTNAPLMNSNLYSKQELVVTTTARFKFGWQHKERIFLVILMSAALIYKPAQKTRHQALGICDSLARHPKLGGLWLVARRPPIRYMQSIKCETRSPVSRKVT